MALPTDCFVPNRTQVRAEIFTPDVKPWPANIIEDGSGRYWLTGLSGQRVLPFDVIVTEPTGGSFVMPPAIFDRMYRARGANDDGLLRRHMVHRRGNWWDSFGSPWFERDLYLFSSHNVGIPRLCNLHYAGSLGHGSHVLLDHWYARTNVTDADGRSLIDAYAAETVCTLSINDKETWKLPLSDLLRATPWVPPERREAHVEAPEMTPVEIEVFNQAAEQGPPVPVPIRSCVGVRVRSYGRGHDALESLQGSDIGPVPTIWIHLEGVETRLPSEM